MNTRADSQDNTPTLTMRVAAACRDPRHHCALVLAVNSGLVACAAAEPFSAALALHLMLLPFNAWRLLHALRSGAAAQRATRPVAGASCTPTVVAVRQRAESMRAPAFESMAAMQTVRLSPRPAP